MTTRRKFIQGAAGAALALPAIVSSARAADAIKVALPLGFAIDFFDTMNAYSGGHYAKFGLDCKVIGANTGVQMTQLVVSGQTDFGRGAPPDQVRAVAAGQAAPIAADGEAQSQALAEVAGAWKDSGGRAMDMFVLQHLDAIFGDVAKAAQRIKIAEVNLIDGGDGKTIPSYAAAYPATMAALFEQVTKTLGIDVARVITGSAPNGAGRQS